MLEFSITYHCLVTLFIMYINVCTNVSLEREEEHTFDKHSAIHIGIHVYVVQNKRDMPEMTLLVGWLYTWTRA